MKSKFYTDNLIEIFTGVKQKNYKYVILYFILFFIFIITALSSIKYSEKITGNIYITPKDQVYTIVSPNSGKVILLKNEKDSVKVNEVVGYIESTSRYEDVLNLKNDLIKIDIENFNNDDLFKVAQNNNYSLGTIQEKYYNFILTINQYRSFLSDNIYEITSKNYTDILNNRNKEINIYKKIYDLQLLMNNLEKQNFKKDSILSTKSIISKTNINKSENYLLSYKEKLLNTDKSIRAINVEISQINGQRNINETQKRREKAQHILNIKKDYYYLLNSIQNWEHTYLLTSSINGVLQYARPLLKNYDYLQRDSKVMYVLPSSNILIGKASVSAKSYGELKVSQDAIIKINDYPFRNYGYLKGQIVQKSPLIQDSIYYLDVMLNDGIRTNTGIELEYYYNMSGSVEFTTRKRSILTRLLNVISNNQFR